MRGTHDPIEWLGGGILAVIVSAVALFWWLIGRESPARSTHSKASTIEWYVFPPPFTYMLD